MGSSFIGDDTLALAVEEEDHAIDYNDDTIPGDLEEAVESDEDEDEDNCESGDGDNKPIISRRGDTNTDKRCGFACMKSTRRETGESSTTVSSIASFALKCTGIALIAVLAALYNSEQFQSELLLHR